MKDSSKSCPLPENSVGRGYILVEGHGEVNAVVNLLTRLWRDLGLPDANWAQPIRPRRITTDDGVRQACEQVRGKPDAEMLLLIRDSDDGCPHNDAPRLARVIHEMHLPIPAAVVLAYREYESLFLASLSTIRGQELVGPSGVKRPGITRSAAYNADPSARRDAKGWLSMNMPKGRIYKETLDQLPLTRLVDFETVRASGLRWFATLENALRFLAARRTGSGHVYPPPANEA